jgi:hypothetical protein
MFFRIHKTGLITYVTSVLGIIFQNIDFLSVLVFANNTGLATRKVFCYLSFLPSNFSSRVGFIIARYQ